MLSTFSPIQFEDAPSGSDYVRWIQLSLNRVMAAGLAVDGKVGAKTRAAVARFQQRRGLPADGLVGTKTEAALLAAGAGRPPARQPAPPTRPITLPSVGPCRLDSQVGELTIVRAIPLGVAGVPNETAIYLPPALPRSPRVDLIIYLHGWETNRAGKIICGRARTVTEYLQHPSFQLREIVRDGGKRAILVVPKLGGHSEPGALVRPGGFAAFVDRVLSSLAACGQWASAPSLGRLILAAHSGGGAAVGQIAAVNGELVANLTEVWMFDALYGGASAWAKFLAARPAVVGRFAFTIGGNTSAHHRSLRDQLPSQRAEIRLSKTTNHCLVPRVELGTFLAQSSLQSR